MSNNNFPVYIDCNYEFKILLSSSFTGAPLLPACLIIDEADDHFSGSKSEHVLLDIVHAIRPRLPPDHDAAPDPIQVLSLKNPPKQKTPKQHLPYPGAKQTERSTEANDLGVKFSSGPIRVIESIPRNEVSPIQLIFCGATLPDGRANTVGQRILQRLDLLDRSTMKYFCQMAIC